MGIDDSDPFIVSRSGNNYLTVTHKDSDEHLFAVDGRRIVGDDLITPAAAKIKQLDPHKSLLDANKHSTAARLAAEYFLKQQFD